MKINSDYLPVPVMALHVGRTVQATLTGPPAETTYTELEGFYITPEDSMAGQQARKLSFLEAVQRFIV